VENLFDDVSNGTEYREYDPGEGEWNTRLFHTKMLRITEVIESVIPHGPDIIALQEIENDNALSALNDNYLKNFGYRHQVIAGEEDVAVRVALLSRLPINSVRVHRLQLEQITGYPLVKGIRAILEVSLNYSGEELIILNNHWKSRVEGAEETEQIRLETAALVGRRIREIRSENREAAVVVLGDLNENHDEYLRIKQQYQTALLPEGTETPERFIEKSLFLTFNREAIERRYSVEQKRGDDKRVLLYSTWKDTEQPGSYVFRQEWNTLDHILLSPALFNNKGLSYNSFEVVIREFFLNSDGYPWKWDPSKASGYSDHLPLLLTLSVE